MGGFESFFLAIARGFTPEVNMLVTRAAGIACSFADIAFVWILLKTAHALKPAGTPAPRVRYLLLAVFAVLTPALALPADKDDFLIRQSLILGIPYLMLAHTAVTELPILHGHLRERIRARLSGRQ